MRKKHARKVLGMLLAGVTCMMIFAGCATENQGATNETASSGDVEIAETFEAQASLMDHVTLNADEMQEKLSALATVLGESLKAAGNNVEVVFSVQDSGVCSFVGVIPQEDGTETQEELASAQSVEEMFQMMINAGLIDRNGDAINSSAEQQTDKE